MGKASSLQGSESGRGRSIPLFQNGTGIRENGLGGKCLARLKSMWVIELQIILCLCDGVRGMNSTAETRRRRVKRREDIIEGGGAPPGSNFGYSREKSKAPSYFYRFPPACTCRRRAAPRSRTSRSSRARR